MGRVNGGLVGWGAWGGWAGEKELGRGLGWLGWAGVGWLLKWGLRCLGLACWWAGWAGWGNPETEIGLFENGKGVSPPKI